MRSAEAPAGDDSAPEIRHYWAGGALAPTLGNEPQRILGEAPGPYTAARVEHGRARWLEAHCARLTEDSLALGLPPPAPEAIREGFETLARAVFGDGPGIVRMATGEKPSGESLLVAEARALGPGGAAWRAAIAPFPHPGPGRHPGAKLSHVSEFEQARALCLESALDEVLLFDNRGRLVEGARSSLIVIDGEGRARTPSRALGGVKSIALAKIYARQPLALLADPDLRRPDLDAAREIIAVNAVRGARAITRLDGRAVGTGRAGEGARILERSLAEAGA
ncbi:MAG: aminotransferase class IV [Myxococcota bacterium]|nr:aminotransferase class IV [Myxococcota bacterium]